MSDDVHTIASRRLARDGQRYTQSRRVLVEVLAAADHPLSIPGILEAGPRLAQSSVYRNLAVLERAGVVSKVVTTGERGMMITSDETLARRADRLKELAHIPGHRFLHDEIGFNYQMTNLQAALGIAQLERIEESIAKKRWMADRYRELLTDVPGLLLPSEAPWARSVYWMYAVRVTEESPLSRDEVMAGLRERGVDTRTFFTPMHQQPVFQRLGWFAGERYPVAEALSATGFYLPSGLAITDEQIQTVCAAVKSTIVN